MHRVVVRRHPLVRLQFRGGEGGRRQRRQRLSSIVAGTQRRASPSAAGGDKAVADKDGGVAEARPSASVILLSATNKVLVLQRAPSSTSFASAHIFPGGNVDARLDGCVAPPPSPARHRDGPAYRMVAVRECFEETGILLARSGGGGGLVGLLAAERDAAQAGMRAGDVSFAPWLASRGAAADTEELVPLTRWITPAGMPRRFTTQMYLYSLPLAGPETATAPDEHTAALWASPVELLRRADAGAVTLFPPQYYLLCLVADALGADEDGAEAGPARRAAQRARLQAWLRRTPTGAAPHATARIPWADKVVCPERLPLRRRDGRAVLALHRPGPELDGTSRGGDWDRVLLVDAAGGVPRRLKVRERAAVLREVAAP